MAPARIVARLAWEDGLFFHRKSLFSADVELIVGAIKECKRRQALRLQRPLATLVTLPKPHRATFRGVGLIETGRRPSKRSLLRASGSLATHAAVIVAAAYGTLAPRGRGDTVRVDTTMVLLEADQQRKPPEPEPVPLEVPLKGFQTVVVPPVIPANIPAVDLQQHFDVRDYSGQGVEGGVASGREPTAGEVFDEDIVQERPMWLSGPPLVYPEVLREAGIEGRVVIEAVIDTLGRVEPSSLRIVQSSHAGFVAAAKDFVLGAKFRPARLHGRRVRVLVTQPVKFAQIRNAR